MKFVSRFLVLFFCLFSFSSQLADDAHSADLIIFSYDRPLQLYALLESVRTYVADTASITVIYRVSSEEYAAAYNQVFQDFPGVTVCKQGDSPTSDFKQLTLQAFFNSPSNHVIFAVDDIVVTGYVSLADCARAMEATGAYGFFLRLGTHLDFCYPMNCAQALPPMAVITGSPLFNNVCCWQFAQGQYDWNYPHTVDMTLYRKKDIASDISDMEYHSPNTLEAQWDTRARAIKRRIGLCYTQARMVNMPLNRVQHDYINRAMDSYTPKELLSIFLSKKKMAIVPLYEIKNRSAHMEYAPQFVAR
jgi:hypothetical protein